MSGRIDALNYGFSAFGVSFRYNLFEGFPSYYPERCEEYGKENLYGQVSFDQASVGRLGCF